MERRELGQYLGHLRQRGGLGFPALMISGIKRAESPGLRASDARNSFQRAGESIQIVSGELPTAIFSSEEILDTLGQALERECSVEVVVGPEVNRKRVEALISRGIPVYQLEQPLTKHSDFCVIDGEHVILGTPQRPGGQEIQYTIRNFKNARQKRSVFNSLKGRARALI